MATLNLATHQRGPLHSHEGWGDIPEADRPLWTRYLRTYMPWFPGSAIMPFMLPGISDGGTRAPEVWKETAQELRSAGFTPLQYYVLAHLIQEAHTRGELDPERHGRLFRHWPESSRGPLVFRLLAHAWTPWLTDVRGAESPELALRRMLGEAGDRPPRVAR